MIEGMRTSRSSAMAMALWIASCGGSPPSMQAAAPRSETDSGSAPREVAPPSPGPAEGPAPGSLEPPATAETTAPARSNAIWDPDAPIVLPPSVVARVRQIAASAPGQRPHVFAKIGDSATASRTFMRCFAQPEEVELGGRDELQAVIDRIRAARVAGRTSFSRDSHAAAVGLSVHTLLRGDPSPVLRELRALSPRFALVMLGGNDVEIGRLDLFARSMIELVDLLTARGVIPILSTAPPRDDDEESDRQIARYDAVIEAIARSRRLPLIDLHRAMRSLPDHGLAADGVHPNAPVVDGRAHACRFDEVGMRYGMNVRNLLNLRMLAHLQEVLARDATSPEVIEAAPEVEVRGERFVTVATTEGGASRVDRYPDCAPTDESGPERRYRLRVDAPGPLRAEVMYDAASVDVDVHLLREGVCVARGDRRLETTVEVGDYEIVVDTFESERRAGEYLLLVER